MADPREELLQNVEELIKSLDQRPQKALLKIIVSERRILAVRNYLRVSKAKLDMKWAWSEEEMKEFLHSEDRKVVEAAIDNIIGQFEMLSGNQEYTLKKADEKRLIRSLDTQIDYWNGNFGVYHLGSQLTEKLLALHSEWSGDLPLFKKYLMGTGPGKQVKLEKMKVPDPKKPGKQRDVKASPTHATPGLSDHGRSNAFDFIVIRKIDGEVVAGTESATAVAKWDTPGWTKKLNDAVINAGNQFDGPLGHPGGAIYEPWHYVYKQK